MSRILIYTLVSCIFFACQNKSMLFESANEESFYITFSEEEPVEKLLADRIIYGSECVLSMVKKQEFSALEIKTSSEFSDAFIDLKKLFGHTIDFSEVRYLSVKIYVPKESWISTLKFNFKDSLGNFGGCQEVFNNFHGHYNQWIEMMVDMQEIIPDFQNWSGTISPLPNTQFLSLNPYNAHQASPSSIYIHSIKLTKEKPAGNFIPRLTEPVVLENNIPYEINFDEDDLLRQHTAFRSFESSFQALDKNIAGNKTTAIRLKGSDQNKHIAFLPILDKITGKSVDFTKVKRLYFSYYLTPESDDFDGSWLYLTSEHWDNILLDREFYRDYEKGSWRKVNIDMANLNLEQVKGEKKVLPNVYELRLDINYFPNRKNIEIWIDDFGWE